MSGDSNVLADCLSRPQVEEVSTDRPKSISAVTSDPFDSQYIAKAQTPEFKKEITMFIVTARNQSKFHQIQQTCVTKTILAQLFLKT